MTEATINETDELRKTVEALRDEIERVSNRGMKGGSAPRGTFVVDTVSGFSWCSDAFCTGMDVQKPATAQRETMTQTNRQRDPSADWGTAGCAPADALENSYERFFFADPDGYICEVCNKPSLEFSTQERPRYERLNQEDPMTLLRRKRSGITPEMVIEEARKKAAAGENGELKELKDQLARQQSALAFVMGQQSGSAVSMPPELVEMLTGTTPAPEPEEPLTPTPSESPVDPPAAATAPQGGVKGYRKRGEGRYEALLYRSETADGKQHSLGSFPTVEEAIAAREAALSEEES